LKYPHHGAWPTEWPGLQQISPEIRRCTMDDFLMAVMPSHVVFSVGRENRDNHIRSETIAAIDGHFRQHGMLRSVHWTETTANCLDPTVMPTDGPLANLSGSGDIEVWLSGADEADVEIRVYPPT
jgi:hypothetical protein